VNLKGQVTVPPVHPPHGWSADGAVQEGLLFRPRHALEIWDPRTRRVTVRIPGAWPLAADGHLLAWCSTRCDKLHILDLRTMKQSTLPPPWGFVRFLGGEAAFSSNGGRLAIPVLTGHHYASPGALFLVNVERKAGFVIPGTRFAGCCGMAWDASGRWLFIRRAGRPRRVIAYRVGSARPRVLSAPRSVGSASFMAAA